MNTVNKIEKQEKEDAQEKTAAAKVVASAKSLVDSIPNDFWDELERRGERGLSSVLAYHCLRCDYVWLPKDYRMGDDLRNVEPPKACARCKSKYWRQVPRNYDYNPYILPKLQNAYRRMRKGLSTEEYLRNSKEIQWILEEEKKDPNFRIGSVKRYRTESLKQKAAMKTHDTKIQKALKALEYLEFLPKSWEDKDT